MTSALTVQIKQINPAGPAITGKLDDGEGISGGYGGWQELDRPRDTAATYWAGESAQTYTLPLIFDGMGQTVSRDSSVEPRCKQLEKWARSSTSKGQTQPPPVLQVTGNLLVGKNLRWVIDDISWGACERNASGRRIQQAVTLTLRRYVAADITTSHAKKAAKKKAAKQLAGKIVRDDQLTSGSESAAG